jgi:hypothetical protein
MKRIGWPGRGWKVTCHRCGCWFPSTEIKKEWTGLLVCETCFETRHPQTLIKVRTETQFPDFVSMDGTDTFTGVCDIVSSSAFADLASADCARADNVTPPYSVLKDLYKNGHGGM